MHTAQLLLTYHNASVRLDRRNDSKNVGEEMRATQSWVGGVIKLRGAGGWALALVTFVVAMAMVIGPSHANPFFATKTGRTCATCHNPGQEMSGIQGLNNTGSNFLRAFRANPDQALRNFAGGSNMNSGGNNNRENCTAKFTCGNNFAICHFRTFANGGSHAFQVNSGGVQRFSGFHRGDGYCMNGQGTPPVNCNRSPIRMESCN